MCRPCYITAVNGVERRSSGCRLGQTARITTAAAHSASTPEMVSSVERIAVVCGKWAVSRCSRKRRRRQKTRIEISQWAKRSARPALGRLRVVGGKASVPAFQSQTHAKARNHLTRRLLSGREETFAWYYNTPAVSSCFSSTIHPLLPPSSLLFRFRKASQSCLLSCSSPAAQSHNLLRLLHCIVRLILPVSVEDVRLQARYVLCPPPNAYARRIKSRKHGGFNAARHLSSLQSLATLNTADTHHRWPQGARSI